MKRIAALFAVLALSTAAFTALAQAESGFKITGGGQTDIGTTGAGDTIAFTAQETADGAKGQVQYVDREEGKVVEVYHGTVNCIEAVDAGDQGAGYLAGEWQNQGTGPFEIYVEDNGEGSNADDDVILIDEQAEMPNCSEDDEDDDDIDALGRGNVQVHTVE